MRISIKHLRQVMFRSFFQLNSPNCQHFIDSTDIITTLSQHESTPAKVKHYEFIKQKQHFLIEALLIETHLLMSSGSNGE